MGYMMGQMRATFNRVLKDQCGWYQEAEDIAKVERLNGIGPKLWAFNRERNLDDSRYKRVTRWQLSTAKRSKLYLDRRTSITGNCRFTRPSQEDSQSYSSWPP